MFKNCQLKYDYVDYFDGCVPIGNGNEGKYNESVNFPSRRLSLSPGSPGRRDCAAVPRNTAFASLVKV